MKSIPQFLLTGAFLVISAASPWIARGQATSSTGGTNNLDEREVLASNVVEHAMAVAETNLTAASNDLAQLQETLSDTNTPAQTNTAEPAPQPSSQSGRNGDSRYNRKRSSGNDSYSRRDSRSSRNDDRVRSTASNAANANGSSSNRPEFSNFRVIAERNIFDPNRRGARSTTPRERPRSVDSFGLVGTMSYEKGTFAFFDGSSSSYRKALKQNDTIAGYRLETIDANQVRLAEGTNHFELHVGSQLRREDGGPWTVSRQVETFAASNSGASTPTTSTSTTSSSDSASSGGESDLLRKLRERREKE
jgi:hypothetical protein